MVEASTQPGQRSQEVSYLSVTESVAILFDFPANGLLKTFPLKIQDVEGLSQPPVERSTLRSIPTTILTMWTVPGLSQWT